MICPSCKKSNTSVVDSRELDCCVIRRRRECIGCKYRFSTYERAVPIKIKVEKKSGAKEPYSREKIYHGVALATEKLTIDESKINDIVDSIEQQIISSGDNPILTSKIGKIVLKTLKELDKVAYLRFSSVYKGFSSIKSFEQELKKLEQIKNKEDSARKRQ